MHLRVFPPRIESCALPSDKPLKGFLLAAAVPRRDERSNVPRHRRATPMVVVLVPVACAALGDAFDIHLGQEHGANALGMPCLALWGCESGVSECSRDPSQ